MKKTKIIADVLHLSNCAQRGVYRFYTAWKNINSCFSVGNAFCIDGCFCDNKRKGNILRAMFSSC